MRHLIAGNWKMNGLRSSLNEITKLKSLLAASQRAVDVLVCPPVTLLERLVVAAKGTVVKCGAQDCHASASGAHTGDVSAEMLSEAGAEFVIVGHSERRADHAEADVLVKAKAEAAQRAGMMPIICVGETQNERENGRAIDVVTNQLLGSLPNSGEFVVAYEPVWAIGTGLVPTLADIEEMHGVIRGKTAPAVRLLYGGSVKPSNAGDILQVANVNGALVGGASLKADDFHGIIDAYK